MPLQYKTRGQSDPRGKNRVYFCCHPEDFSLYLDLVSDEILRLQNCTIWYDEDGVSAALDEERKLELGQMQLFVMPVTARLLGGENPGLANFRFAVERHIPVLPLMQEMGLEARFNQICGDIQFLDPYDRDPTALPYEQKLAGYLDSVLVGDELARQIRDAFDAYVFLSYRKKDRKYAQELMRLIHQNDFCRDIAIWYDEYLTPGENFNDAIAAAMAKSQLFALAVTPNLVNEKNYVMTTEYPEAKKAGKTILPVEIIPTDRSVLEAYYQDIPDCVDAHNETALVQALSNSLEQIALRENRDDPQHTFFIGLAYLNGIDVEMDRKRAAELITQAANGGLPEAMTRLADMYRSGTGVERDHETCIRWMERLVELRKQRHQQAGTERTLQDLSFALSGLCESLADINRWEDAKSAGIQQVEYLEAFACRAERPEQKPNGVGVGWLPNELVYAYARLSGYSMEAAELKEGPLNFQEAKAFAQRSVELARQLVQQDPSTIGLLAMGYRNRMQIARSEGDLDTVDRTTQELVEISLRVYEETDTAEAKDNLARAYKSRGSCLWSAKRLEEAQVCYQEAEQLYVRLAADDARTQSLADVYYALGRIHYRAKRLDTAREYFQKSAELSAYLVEDRGQKYDIRTLSANYKYLGMISSAVKQRKEAVEFFQKSIAVWEQVPDEAMAAEDYVVLAGCCSCLGRQTSDYEALETLEQARGAWDRLAKRYPNKLEHKPRFKREKLRLARVYMQEASDLKAQYDFNWAWGFYRGAAQILAQLEAGGMKTFEVRSMLSEAYMRLAEAEEIYDYNETGPDTAKDYLLRALELNLSFVKERGTEDDLWRLSDNYRLLGSLSRTEGRTETAEEYIKAGIAVWDQTEENHMSAKSRAMLAEAHSQLASLTHSVEELEKSCHIWDRLVGQYPGYASKCREARLKLAGAYMDKAAGLLEAGQPEEAVQLYRQKAAPLYTWLETETQELSDIFQRPSDLSEIYFALGQICFHSQQPDTAGNYFRRSVEQMQQYIETGCEPFPNDLKQLSKCYEYLGVLSCEKGEAEEAKRFFEQSKKEMAYAEQAERWLEDAMREEQESGSLADDF